MSKTDEDISPEMNDGSEAHAEGAKVDGRVDSRNEDIDAAAPKKDEEDNLGGGGTEREEGHPEVDVRTEDPQRRERGGGGDGKLR